MIARIRAKARLILLVTLATAAAAPIQALGQACLAATAADEFTADEAGLTREWILQLPFVASGYSLNQVVVGDGLVVAQTTDGTVHAVQAAPWGDAVPTAGAPRPGSLLWSQRVGARGGPITRAGIGPDLVAIPNEKGLTALERPTGQLRWHESFSQNVSGGVAVIGNWVYLPNSAGAVNRFAVNPLRQPAVESATADDKPATGKTAKKSAKKTKAKRQRKENLDPVAIHAGGSNVVEIAPIKLADGVLWCTSDGLLVTLQPSELDWRRLEFSLENPPAGPPVVRDRSIFATTTAGDLARIELPSSVKKDLQLTWHTVLPGPAFSGPLLSGDTIVVSLGDLGIAAYSAETGTELWQTCLTGTILAIGGGRVWLIDELGKLSAFDLQDGTPRERLCLGPFTLPVVNTHSDRLLLASPSGMLVSLAPRAIGTPTPAEAADAAATAPAAPARGPSDPAATPRP
jgi:outer membrane protein assembly factor BamB